MVCIAPVDLVDAVYGSEGADGKDRLAARFGGAVIFRNDGTEERYLGVWGARDASRFRRILREAGFDIALIKERPRVRLVWYQTRGERPPSHIRAGRIGNQHIGKNTFQ